MKKLLTIALIIIMALPATAMAGKTKTIDPFRYDGGDREYERLMDFINTQIEAKGLRGTEMVAERKKQQKAFMELMAGDRRHVKKAMKEVCTKTSCDYAEALFEYRKIMDQRQ